ncbi:MAG: sugar phosphate isomerase/epimerase [Ruminococcaceae bacterium]|nr:sugar phosphate isomerase/epimerase [Oscillospiraceae bacterium]
MEVIQLAKTQKPGIHRGVSTYCWYPLYNVNMDLEDSFQIMQDMGATGLEILADGIIDGYPYPSNEWLDKWFALIDRYDIVPVEYGHWVESRLYRGRECTLEESLEQLIHDIKLAGYLGFTCMRTKLGVIDETLSPVKNWREIIKAALPYAEKYNVVMQPEIHSPTKLKSPMMDDYCEFIDKEQTKHFGFNIDFGVFQNKSLDGTPRTGLFGPSAPEDIVPLLPYVHCCHAKYYNMSEDFDETTIPYREVIKLMQDNGWNGYLLSEYEGPHKENIYHCMTQVHRHHVMLKNILGE